jgi:hypothetical protein
MLLVVSNGFLLRALLAAKSVSAATAATMSNPMLETSNNVDFRGQAKVTKVDVEANGWIVDGLFLRCRHQINTTNFVVVLIVTMLRGE